MIKSKTIIATPPGATIKEQIKDRGMTQKELALRMQMSEKHICELLKGNVQLTPDVALRLENILGIPASFWNNLEAIYRDKITRANAENQIDTDIDAAKNIPFKEMVKFKWVKQAKNDVEKITILRNFFEVSGLTALKNPEINKIACRRLVETEHGDYALMTWAQKAKLEARKHDVSDINISKVKTILKDIRSMTTENPKTFCSKLEQCLASCGIAIVFLPHIGGSFLHGATFYDGKKIVMGLTVRGKDADRFWFSLFHEIGHVVLGHIGKDCVTIDDERAADLFAENSLIPQEKIKEFLAQNNFSKNNIIKFANSIKIAPGIVVGRLQKENYIGYNRMYDLKEKYAIVS